MTINDLKCCGNCEYRVSVEMGDYTHDSCENIEIEAVLSSDSKCQNWKWDGIEGGYREQRGYFKYD